MTHAWTLHYYLGREMSSTVRKTQVELSLECMSIMKLGWNVCYNSPMETKLHNRKQCYNTGVENVTQVLTTDNITTVQKGKHYKHSIGNSITTRVTNRNTIN